VPIGGSTKTGEAPQTIEEMTAQLLELEGEDIELVQATAAGKCGIISEDEFEMLLHRHAEVFEGCCVGWKSSAVVKDKNNKDKPEDATRKVLVWSWC